MKRWVLVAALVALGCNETKKAREDTDEAANDAPDDAEPFTAKEVKKALEGSDFDVSDVVVYDEDTDPNELLGRPGQYVVKVNFKTNGGDGSIEGYEDIDGAKGRKKYIDNLAKTQPIAVQYIYINERRTAVLRIPKEVKPKEAKRWEKWFQKL